MRWCSTAFIAGTPYRLVLNLICSLCAATWAGLMRCTMGFALHAPQGAQVWREQIRAIRSIYGMLRIARSLFNERQRALSIIRPMASIDPHKWAQEMADGLSPAGERIPFDRVLKAQLDAVVALRQQGFTWRGLANLLARAGARRADGKTFSADHLRVCFSRLKSRSDTRRKAVSSRTSPGRQHSLASSGSDAPSFRPRPLPRRQSDIAGGHPSPGTDDPLASGEAGELSQKDVSMDELSAALGRLNRQK